MNEEKHVVKNTVCKLYDFMNFLLYEHSSSPKVESNRLVAEWIFTTRGSKNRFNKYTTAQPPTSSSFCSSLSIANPCHTGILMCFIGGKYTLPKHMHFPGTFWWSVKSWSFSSANFADILGYLIFLSLMLAGVLLTDAFPREDQELWHFFVPPKGLPSRCVVEDLRQETLFFVGSLAFRTFGFLKVGDSIALKPTAKAPENGWLEDEISYWGDSYFQGIC